MLLKCPRALERYLWGDANILVFFTQAEIKWLQKDIRHHLRRKERKEDVKVYVPVHVKCKGFTWYGAKIWNQLPVETRT